MAARRRLTAARRRAAAVAAACAAAGPPAGIGCAACTLVAVPGGGGGEAVARTMELNGAPRWAAAPGPSTAPPWRFAVYPAGEALLPHPFCEGRSSGWRVQHPFVAFETPTRGDGVLAGDGLNAAGLAVWELTLHGSAYVSLGDSTRGRRDPARVCWMDFVRWALGSHATVGELKDVLKANASVVAVLGNADGAGMHWAARDAAGGAIVVESVGGVLAVHDDAVGVLTNDPPYAWHLHNLNSYAALAGAYPDVPRGFAAATAEVGSVPAVTGHGYELRALPGDFSPPGRFVRVFFLRQLALARAAAPRNATEAAVLAAAVAAAVTIPRGAVAPAPGEEPEFTQYTTVTAPRQRWVQWRTYDRAQWRRVDLRRVDFSRRRSTPLFDGDDGVADVTAAV